MWWHSTISDIINMTGVALDFKKIYMERNVDVFPVMFSDCDELNLLMMSLVWSSIKLLLDNS